MIEVKVIDELLPQTQCGECGYAGCLPYAEALAQGSACINLCPPGGAPLVKALGNLLDVDPHPYLANAQANTRAPSVALIREAECIGCTKCIQACPVDAIIGSGKLMHSVLSQECTGCGLCIEPCPVDCIEMQVLPESSFDKALARQRFNARKARFIRMEQEKQQLYREKRRLAQQNQNDLDLKAKREYILKALERVQAKKP
ncbi:RnfABCDGE type electron transport complex subunit B [Legionella jordanis]|uniref:Electron transport complex protein n=1 Tax=Legionella jordanis TaxID=456 RepID=A0A0W0VCG9_9GAMM|nr:RnfABCDGE type electron transport complex subunit B [Legionella jordanis]KTD17811.1 electron transport complex protein [Legionella jordanis]RMX02486.1 RnfABCDGE type electron transport complex subunit B [Legionella jordanis]RMX21671.1 RnfABCDGE type electron transport complex subunit B [Legionella jordanis]VEH11252.1 iron-sulfur cluster binding protein [Legionella jordanis]HAT8713780.1 RnfABCDGE type electron transport complex subunit B [Legionella jordanis]